MKHLLIFLILLGVPSLAIAQSIAELKVESVEVLPNPEAKHQRDDFEIYIRFNRPLTEEEVDPARGYRLTYGLKYWLTSKTGWNVESYSVSPIQKYLFKSNPQTYWLTSESSHHPVGRFSMNPEVDRAFKKGNFSAIKIALYQQDKAAPKAKYELLGTFEFKDL